MDNREAKELLEEYVALYRLRPYSELADLIGREQTYEVTGQSGAVYQVEVSVTWDDKQGGNVRVLASIDDGGWRAFHPLSDDFIKAPDGEFVGE